MEVKESSRKRETIKNIAIIFLAVMLVLTFFSNTIMNRSLPEVSTSYAISDSINAKVRVTGTVNSADSYEIVLDQTRRIHSICVREGDVVNQGDVLFLLEDGDSAELESAREQLRSAEMNYQQQLLTLSRNYSSEDYNIQKLQKALDKAIAQRDANLVTAEELANTATLLTAKQKELVQVEKLLSTDLETQSKAQSLVDTLTAQLDAINSQINSYDDSAEIAASIARDNAETALQTAKEQLELDLLRYQTTYNSLVDAVVATDAFRTYVRKTLEKTISTVEDALLDAYCQDVAKVEKSRQFQSTAYSTLINQTTLSDGVTSSPLKTCLEKLDVYLRLYLSEVSADNAMKIAYTTLTADEADVTAKQQAVSQMGFSGSTSNLYYERNTVNSKLTNAKKELTTANTAVQSREQQKQALEDEVSRLTELSERCNAYESAVQLVEDSQQQLSDSLQGKKIDRQLDDMNLETLRLEVEKQKKNVEKLSANTLDTQVTARVSGTVRNISVSAGKEVYAGSSLATLEMTDRGYTLQGTVTAQQAKQLHPGDTAEVSNYYWGAEIHAVLESINPEPGSNGQSKRLIFRIEGDVDSGTNLTLSLGQRSTTYDTVIPKSALRSDSNGDFVLVMMAKSSPLGNRYVATRVDITILASDDTKAAVSGLSYGDYVITTASRPLEAGMLVRMVDAT